MDSDFAKRTKKYVSLNPQELVFLHTDREIYSPGDIVNFKAYIRDFYTPGAPSLSKNMHLMLIDYSGNNQQEKVFPVSNNQSSGEFMLLNELTEGEYKLIAWTNGMESGGPQNVFQKDIHQKQAPARTINWFIHQTSPIFPGRFGTS